MIRGKQDNTAGSVEGRQVVQEEEEEMKTEKEEEMKTENMEVNESNENNVSSGAFIGEISGSGSGALPKKRTTNNTEQYPQGWLMTENRHYLSK
jgi:hypothetical protein